MLGGMIKANDMESQQTIQQKINDLSNNTIDLALITFSATGLVLMGLLFFDSLQEGFTSGVEFSIQLAMFSTLVIITLLRKKLALTQKYIS